MATYVPPKRATAHRFWVSLVSQTDVKKLQSSPTLAAGDVKVSKDGGAQANLTTLPTVTPAAGVLVQVDLSATEMTADNVSVVFIDAAGAEWCDLMVNLQTTARQVDDLAFPNVSGRGMDVSAAGDVDAAVVTIAAGAIDAAAIATDAIGATEFSQGAADKVWATASRAITDKAGFSLSAAGVQAIWDALTTALTTAGSIGKLLVDNVNATVSSRSSHSAADVWASATRTLTTIAAATVEAATANKVADHVLRRTYGNARASADGDAANFRSLLGAVGKLVNKISISGATLTIFQEDDLTSTAPGGTQALTTDAAANHITAADTA